MITRLLLIRHGASHHTEEGIVGGPQSCRGLTEIGRQQAQSLSRRLAHELPEPPDAIYSSVLPRAVETAQILAAPWNLSVGQDCGLCTWHTPAYADGKSKAAFQLENRIAGGGVFRPFQAENESWAELVIRTGRTLEQIASQHAGDTVLIVAHTETVNSAFIVFGGLPLALAFDLQVARASLTEWYTQGDPDAWPRPRWTLARFNDAAHHLVSSL